MPSRWTFTIPPIRNLLGEEITGLTADPFAGQFSPAQDQNDIQPDMGSANAAHTDALLWLSSRPTSWYDTVLYDPPYSITQARMYGKKEFSSMRYWAQCKNEMARIIKPGGKALCFGWNSMGLGKNRGFILTRILLVAHGGSKNDTIATVERKEA